MKRFIIFLAVIGFFGLIAGGFHPIGKAQKKEASETSAPKNLTMKNKAPVLVELYTSEGCSSCPPADRVLSRLEREQSVEDAEIITLAFHVDYWNSLGWKDEFSSPIFSRRQDIYGAKLQTGSIYTPQMIVDGQTQFVGNNLEAANKAITENAKNKKATVELSVKEANLNIKISGLAQHANATVFLAFAENNLASNVSRGENSGKKLEHTSVVRELKSIGMLAPEKNNFETEIVAQLQPDWKKENVKLVVFVQENESRKILGVNRISLN